MKHDRSQQPYGLLAPAARSALRFAARRNTSPRYAAWHPIAFFWRQQRNKLMGLHAGKIMPATAVIWLLQVHLHGMIRENTRSRRDSLSPFSPTAAIHQRLVVMNHFRTISQSRPHALRPHRDRHSAYIFSIRQVHSDSGANVQIAAPYTNAAYRPSIAPSRARTADRVQHLVHVFVRPKTHSDWDRSVQPPTLFKYITCRSVILPAMTRSQHLEQRPAYVLSIRQTHNDSGANIQIAAPYTTSTYRSSIAPSPARTADRVQRLVHLLLPPNARSDWKRTVQTTVSFKYVTRRFAIPPSTFSVSESWAADRIQRLVRSFSFQGARSSIGTSVKSKSLYMNPASQLIVPPVATPSQELDQRPTYSFSPPDTGSGRSTIVKTRALYIHPVRRPIVASTITPVADRTQRPNTGRTYLKVRLGTSTNVQGQTPQTLRDSKREPLVFRPRIEAIHNAAPRYKRAAVQPYFHPQELVWHRAELPATNIADEGLADSHRIAQPLGRSFPEQEVASGMPHSSRCMPTAMAMKLDSALMDRLVDDVISRVERRADIERARRGL